jgi:hypothetical protein
MFPEEQFLETVPEVTAVEANVPVNGKVIVNPDTEVIVCVAFNVPLNSEFDKPETVACSPD